MKKCFLALLVVALAFSGPVAFANGNTNDLAYIGINELESATSTGVYTSDGVIVTRSNVPYQGITVGDILGTIDSKVKTTTVTTTVLASESGKVFIATEATKFQLPTAAAGLHYTFVAGANVEIEVQVSTTPDTIVLAADAGNGQGVIETAGANTTGNSVTLTSDGTNWYAIQSTGDWTDGGAWQVIE